MEKQVIEDYINAGRIASEVVKFAKNFIRPNMFLIEIAEKIEGKIQELGGSIAFPVNLSLNEVAAHYTPGLSDRTRAGGILKVDLGVDINGYIADCAFSLDLSEKSEFEDIIKTNEKALESALLVIKSNVKIGEIGSAIQNFVGSKFSIVKNLSGHSLEKDSIHSGITIPNYSNDNMNKLKNVAIAIEPFLTFGDGYVYESSKSEIFMLQDDKPLRDKDSRALLKFIKENYKTKPFCKRWLERANLSKINFSLAQLCHQGILHNFPVLIEKSKKPVSQFEHTVLILEEKAIITTR
ncbi:MAG: type II methionyl aminopeptidase [Nanoarchaeota archaeon]